MNPAHRQLFLLGFALAAANGSAQPADTGAVAPATSQCALDSLKPLPRLNFSARQNVIAAVQQANTCLGQRDAVCAETAIASVQALTLTVDERALLAIPRAELATLQGDSVAAEAIYRDALAFLGMNEALRRQLISRLALSLNTRHDFAGALRALATSGCDNWTADAWGLRAIAYQNLGAWAYALENFEAAIKLYELEGRAVPAAIHDSREAVLASKAPTELKDGDVAPIVRQNPNYPERALQNGASGWVQLVFDITDNGTVDNVRAVKSRNAIFEEPAITAVQRWRYAPKFENGLATGRTGVETVITFCLEPCNFGGNPPPERGPDGHFPAP